MTRWLLTAIVFLLVARVVWKVVAGLLAVAGGVSKRRGSPASSVRLVRDPVCGTYVAPNVALSLSARGTTHYFCSEKCRGEFRHPRAAGDRR